MPKISAEKKSARRTQILNAAWSCFQRDGLHASTMDQIIRASGLSVGAVYSYFKNKDDLILSSITSSMSELTALTTELLRTEPPLSPGELVERVTETIASFTVRDGFDLRRIAILGWGEAQSNETVRTALSDYYAAFRDQLAQMTATWQARGDIEPSVSADDVAKTLLAVVLGFVAQSAILGGIEPAMLRRGLLAHRVGDKTAKQ